MATRTGKAPGPAGEEYWEPGHNTNMDSLQEAVEYMEGLGHIVIAALLDWGGEAAVLMRRMRDDHFGLQTYFIGGNVSDINWLRDEFGINEED